MTVVVTSLLMVAGVLVLVGAWKRVGLQGPGQARTWAFLAGAVCVVAGFYGLAAALTSWTANQTIEIESVIYGRPQFAAPTVPPFPANTIDCTHYARSVCEAQPNCSLQFSNQACGGDPERGTLKIAEIVYRCGSAEGEPLHAFAVESRVTNLACR